MKRHALTGFALAAIVAAGVGGYLAGLRSLAAPGVGGMLGTAPGRAVAEPEASGSVIYYQDPDDRPIYSAVPSRTADGRDFRAVRASEDAGFEERPAAAAKETDSGESRRVLYYRNPMGLPDTSPVPKKDSMGMDYIPVYESEDDDSSVVKVPLGRLQRTGVRVEPAELRTIGRLLRVPGTVQFDERRISVLTTRSDAFVEEVANVTTGDRVAKGQALVRLYSPDVTAAAARFLSDINSESGGSIVGGTRQRLENLGVPSEAIAEIERSRKVPLSMTWRAPRHGIVLERNAVEGMRTGAGEILFRLADISNIWVLADVSEFDLDAVRIGAPATIGIRSLPGQRFEGRLSLIYPQIEAATRTTRVRIEIANPGGLLLANMYADVEIGIGKANPVVAVPDTAVIDTGTRQLIILDRGGGRFEPRQVTIGAQGNGFTEIREGVESGERVVVAANFLIDAESNLRAALRGLTNGEAQP